MTKIKDPILYKTIKEFLTHYLPEVRRKSPNTVLSYIATINIFLDYIAERYQKKLAKITVADFSADNIQKFMDWITNERKNVATTANLRLTHLRQFCKYLHKCGLISYADYAETKELSKLPDNRKVDFIYLSIEQTKLVLNSPDCTKKTGLRDKFYLSLLYDSGCRNQEILDLQLKDFLIKDNGKAELQVIGKGNKYRVIPISDEVVSLYKEFTTKYHPDAQRDCYLFYTRKKNGEISKMSDDNAARILKKYEQLVRVKDPDLPHLHAHLFRRSRAMHLYMAGIALPLISEWLGHAQLETTQIYARASLDMKRDAADTLAAQSGQLFIDETFKYDDDDLIRKLYGLA